MSIYGAEIGLQRQICNFLISDHGTRTHGSNCIRDIIIDLGFLEDPNSAEKNALLWFLNDNPNRRNTFAEDIENPLQAALPQNRHSRQYRILEQPMELNQEFLFRVAFAAIVHHLFVDRRFHLQAGYPYEKTHYIREKTQYIRDNIQFQFNYLRESKSIEYSMENLKNYEHQILETISDYFDKLERGRGFQDTYWSKFLTDDTREKIAKMANINFNDPYYYDGRRLG